MIDTPAEVDLLLRSRYSSRTPAQRVAMATSLFTAAKALALAGIRLEAGVEISEVETRRRLFLRLYGRDFTPERRDEILRAVLGV